MIINRNNYETWFIDSIEGSLTAEQQAELLLFLEQHPDLKAEFDSFINEPLPKLDDELPQSFTASLKRGEVNEQNIDYYLIASLEGDLRAEEQRKLEMFLEAHPQQRQQQKLVALTRLEPVEEIYPDKKKLRQPVPMILPFTTIVRYAVAAMLLLSVVAGSYIIYTKTVSTSQVQMSDTNPLPESEQEELQSQPPVTDPVMVNTDSSAIPANKTNTVKDEVKQELNRQRILQKSKPEYPMAQKVEEEKEQAPDSNPVPVDIPQPEQNLAAAEPQKEQPAPVQSAQPAATEEFASVWDAIRGSAEKSARKFTGQESEYADNSRKSRPRVLDLIGKGIEKASGDKVKYNSQYDENGNLSALNVDAGWFGIEKNVE